MGLFIFLFVSNIRKKKTFHRKPTFDSKVTTSTRILLKQTFLIQKWIFCEMFFFVYSTQTKKWASPSSVVFLTYICFVFHQNKLYSWGKRSGAFVMDNSQQMDDDLILILSIYFSWRMIKKKIMFFLRSAMEGLWNVIFIFLLKT